MEDMGMTRTTAREIAVQLGFSVVMTDDFADDTLDRFFDSEHYATLAGENPLYSEYPDKKQMDYIRRVVQLIFDHRIEADAYIQKYARGWKVGRISRTATAIMRCAICEILYMDDIPNAAAINEAVQMAKGYENDDAVAFINGVLGGFVRGELDEDGNRLPFSPFAADEAEEPDDEEAPGNGAEEAPDPVLEEPVLDMPETGTDE